MNDAIKILICGLGGVGGYLGSKLAYYSTLGHKEIATYFLARGENLERIEKNGILLKAKDYEIQSYPKLATDDVSQLPKMDYIFICTKSYDLDQLLMQIKPVIKDSTILIPFLNGLEVHDILEKQVKHGVMKGCAYIVSYVESPGVIVETGRIARFIWGQKAVTFEMLRLQNILVDAGIDSILSTEIDSSVWEKFSFISPVATLTSYLDITYGMIAENKIYQELLNDLFKEFRRVAYACGVSLPEALFERHLLSIQKFAKDTTTSMQRDFAGKRKTELEALTGYIIKKAEEHHVEIPYYSGMYAYLRSKADR
ncbi:MAG: ketopantoate reductase family protein [Bacteroidales bacterium]